MPGEAIGRALIQKALMKYWGQRGAVIQCLPFPSSGIAGHKFTQRSGSVCQLFPKTGGGDLTHGRAPLQGFWQDAGHHPAALLLPMSPFARPPAQQDSVGGAPSPEQLLAKSLPRGYGGES